MFGRWHTLARHSAFQGRALRMASTASKFERNAILSQRAVSSTTRPPFASPLTSMYPLMGKRLNLTASARRHMSNKSKEEGPGALRKVEATQDALSTEVTVQQGIRNTATNTAILTACGLAMVCAYFIVQELFPGKMSPNAVFNRALKVVKDDGRLKEIIGHPIKGYGRDNGGKRTGRRNFVTHKRFKDEDEIAHTRVRFNAEGPRGKAVIYADVSDSGSSEDFYYLIVEVPSMKKKWAIHDNRPRVPKAVRQDEVATVLQQRAKAVLYGSDGCKYTRKQLLEFGEAVKRIKYVACDKDPEFCKKKGVEFLPTWEIRGRLTEPGYRTMDDLAVMAKQIE